MSGSPSSTPLAASVSRRRRRRSIWFHLHFWIGWLAAIPLGVVCLTGVALAFEEEFYRWEQPEYYDLDPVGEALSLPEVLERYEAARPRLHLFYLGVPSTPEHAYLAFATEIGEDGAEDRGLRAYLDPYTGIIHREYKDPTLINQFEVWHRTLTLGKPGRWIIGASSILLALTSIIGIILWWPMRGRTFVRAWRRGRPLDWHNALGLLALLPLSILAITGITFTWGRLAFPLLDELQGAPSRFEVPELTANGEVEGGTTTVSMASAAIQVAKAFPDLTIRGVQDSRRPERPYTFHLRAPGDFHPGGDLKVFIDPRTGEEVSRFHVSDTGPVGWYRRYFHIFHTGSPFSIWARGVWGLFSLIGGVLVFTGMWISIRRWNRNRRATA